MGHSALFEQNKRNANYPFGMLQPGRSFAPDGYRFGFNGKENDNEIKGTGNSLDFGARIYDPRVGRWLTTDPKHQFNSSQYQAFANKPILLIDPDGGWVPGVNKDGTIILTAEKGDNMKSLYAYFGGKTNAAKYIDPRMVTKWAEAKILIQTGNTVKFNHDNVFQKAMDDVKQNPEKYESSNYNCHTAALDGSQDKEFHNKQVNDLGNLSERNEVLKENYTNVTANEAEFGSTIITFGDAHSANFFGKSKDGTTYIFSKNGFEVAPAVMSMKELITGTIGYGYVGNPTNDGSMYPVENINNAQIDPGGRKLGTGGKGISISNGTGYFNPKKNDKK